MAYVALLRESNLDLAKTVVACILLACPQLSSTNLIHNARTVAAEGRWAYSYSLKLWCFYKNDTKPHVLAATTHVFSILAWCLVSVRISSSLVEDTLLTTFQWNKLHNLANNGLSGQRLGGLAVTYTLDKPDLRNEPLTPVDYLNKRNDINEAELRFTKMRYFWRCVCTLRYNKTLYWRCRRILRYDYQQRSNYKT